MKPAATLAILTLVLTSLGALPGSADGPHHSNESYGPKNPDDPNECKGPDCAPARTVCLNVFCSYFDDGDNGDKGQAEVCRAGAVLKKKVTADGREIEDTSESPLHPEFSVECADHTLFDGGAHRYTDYKGTRIQAFRGPYPAILLPKGALKDAHHYVPSRLELKSGTSYRGYCFIYTGPQLMLE